MPTRSAVKTIHHIVDGPCSMYLVDARSAIGRFPKEWREKPWTEREREAHLARLERGARRAHASAADETEPEADEQSEEQAES